MRGISFCVSPIRDHTFFEKPQFQCLLGDNLLQVTSLTAKGLNLACRGRTGSITRKPPFTSLKKLLRPFVIDTLGNAFAAAQLGDGLLTT
jgi:hypothetical protein